MGRRLSVLVAVAAVVFTGCGTGTTPTPTQTTTPTQSTTATPSSAAPVEIVWWHMEQPPNRVAAYQQVLDDFNASHPGIHVTQQVQDWNTIFSKIGGAIGSNTAPDILHASGDFTPYTRSMGENVVVPVTDLVNELDQLYHFNPAATALYRDGEMWAVPMYGMIQVLWYRKDFFRDAAIAAPPATWEELVADAEQLTDGDRYGIALPAGKNMATDQVIYSLMATAHAEDLYDNDGNVTFDNANTVRAFQLYNDLLPFSPPDSTNYSWGEPQAAFNSGAAAMSIEKGQYLPPWEAESGQPASDLGCALIPQPAQNGQPGSIYYAEGMQIMTKDPVKQAAAAEFIKYVMQPDVYGVFLNAEPGLFLPVTEAGLQAQSWLGDPTITKYKDCVNLMLDQAESGVLFGFTHGQYTMSIGEITGQSIIAQTVQKMWVDHMTPQAAVTWGQAEMEAAVE
ncbi:MAG: ABC transporter substrate-binding protein [Mycobacterium sp.]